MAKVADDLAIALDDFFLHIQTELPARLCRVLHLTCIQGFQSIPNLQVSIGSGEHARDATGEGICASRCGGCWGRRGRGAILGRWSSPVVEEARRHEWVGVVTLAQKGVKSGKLAASAAGRSYR